MTETQLNWAGNYRYGAARVHAPETLEEVRELVAGSAKVRALGTRHSFNDIADGPEDLISLARLDRVLALDRERKTVTVEGGIRYGQLAAVLHQAGYALHNLASLPHISVAGACSTATHGSGDGNGNLVTAVTALELVAADGGLVQLSRETDGELFSGAVVGLGGLGVITRITLELSPTFAVRQTVFENLSLAHLEAQFEAVMSSGYSVSLFTNWATAEFRQVWVKSRVEDPSCDEMNTQVPMGSPAAAPLHPIAAISAENCTAQLGAPGPWHERLPHFRMEFTPSVGEELQSEYLVPREHAYAAIRAVYGLRDRVTPLLQVSEVRTIAADDLWMSPCYRQPCVGIHFTWVKDWPAVRAVLPAIEKALAPYHARPHWGKLFTMAPATLQALYPRLPDFRRLLQRYDPGGKFRNAFLDRYIFAA